jgi:hypothetical protein
LDEVKSDEEEWARFETAFTAVTIEICCRKSQKGRDKKKPMQNDRTKTGITKSRQAWLMFKKQK